MKLVVAILGAALFKIACGGTQTVGWYEVHDAERNAVLADCEKRSVDSPDCIHAAVAGFNAGKYKAGKALVHTLDMKVNWYVLDNGGLPQSLNDLVKRPGNAGNWNGPYAKPGDLSDPFGHPIQYKAPGDHGAFDLMFLGRDGKPGGEGMDKDYGNWE